MTVELSGWMGQLAVLTPWLLLAWAALAYRAAELAARARPQATSIHRAPADLADGGHGARARQRPAPVAPPATKLAPPTPLPQPVPRAPAGPVPHAAREERSATAAPAKAAPTPRPAPKSIPVSTAAAVPALPELARPPFPAAPPSADAVAKALALAETAGDDDKRADLMVALGQARFREGALAGPAADTVRNGLILAVQRGRKDTQARARIALGDLSQAGGDLTTACEHWQLARDLYRELNAEPQLKDAEARMRRNGCPTDWVLNDF